MRENEGFDILHNGMPRRGIGIEHGKTEHRGRVERRHGKAVVATPLSR
jgi:hypothetical protein